MAIELLKKPGSEQFEKQTEATCVHHWVIEPPEGQFSNGKCLKCGEEKVFHNYFPHSKWDNEQKNEGKVKSLLSNWDI